MLSVYYKHTLHYNMWHCRQSVNEHQIAMILGTSVALAVFIPLIIGYMTN